MNIYEFLNISALIFPDREALVFEQRRYDYAFLQRYGAAKPQKER